jgi:protocatechuate 3,4-dioxygenase beta subunit
MSRTKRWLCFCSIIFVFIAPSAARVYAQTPDTKVKPTGSISGHVTISQKAAPGILVIAAIQGSQSLMAQTTTDAEGNYHLNGLAAGQLNVTPVAPVYVVPASPMFGQGQVVNLSANEAVENIDFKLTRGGVITGKISDADGRPVIEERITLTPVDEKGAVNRGVPSYRPGNFMMNNTDDRGVYRLYGLPAGRYKVSVGEDAGRSAVIRSAGFYPKTYYPDAQDLARAEIVEVSEGGETKNIDIKVGRRSSTYSVSGRVVDADTNQPLAGVFFSVGVVQQSQNQSYVNGTSGPGTPTNSQGEFRMEGLSPGRYAFTVGSSNYVPNATPGPKVYSDPLQFEILDADVSNLEIKAQRGLSISGVIVPDGITDKNILSRLSKLQVWANVNPGSSEIRFFNNGSSAQVNPDGGFVIEGLRPGKVSIFVGANGPNSSGFAMTRVEHNGVVQGREIDLPRGQDLSGLRIFVTYGTGVIRGQIKVEGGVFPSDALIFIIATRPNESNPFNTQADSRGRFLIKGVPPGTYEVMMQIANFGGGQLVLTREVRRPQRQTVTVADGADTEVVFTLDLGVTKEGP